MSQEGAITDTTSGPNQTDSRTPHALLPAQPPKEPEPTDTLRTHLVRA